MNKQEENEIRVSVTLLDMSGDTCVQMTQPEALDLVEQHSGTHWVFANNRLVEAAQLANADWAEMAENNTTVQLVPQLVGGL